MNILKSAIAGAASAVGTHYADVAVNPTPHSPTVYYGVGAAGLLGAIWFRNSSPIAAGVLLGVGLGSAYQGYTRASSTAGAPGLMSSLSALLAASDAIPRTSIGGIPITRRSVGANSGGKIAIDQRAFSPKIAPYGVVSYAIAPNTATQAWYTKEPYASSHGVPLTALWPYGLDADRFALPPRPILGAIAGLPTVVKVGAPAAAVAALLFFL